MIPMISFFSFDIFISGSSFSNQVPQSQVKTEKELYGKNILNTNFIFMYSFLLDYLRIFFFFDIKNA